MAQSHTSGHGCTVHAAFHLQLKIKQNCAWPIKIAFRSSACVTELSYRREKKLKSNFRLKCFFFSFGICIVCTVAG